MKSDYRVNEPLIRIDAMCRDNSRPRGARCVIMER